MPGSLQQRRVATLSGGKERFNGIVQGQPVEAGREIVGGGSLVAGLLVLLGFTIGTVSVADAGPKKFYLTQSGANGSQALTACDGGYHMASIWEILDPSNLKYDTNRGRTLGDSGSGPPTEGAGLGWIRAGEDAAVGPAGPGFANCNAWTSNNGADVGTVVGLKSALDAASLGVINPWRSQTEECSEGHPVWCVKD